MKIKILSREKSCILNKKYLIPVFLAVIALLLVILSSEPQTQKNDQADATVALGILSEELELKIQRMCEKVDGVGDVYVMLTLDTSEEYVYASDTEQNQNYARSSFVTTDDGEGVELYVVCPKVRGVAVVCDGGDRAIVKKTLSELISSALGISVSKISVAGT